MVVWSMDVLYPGHSYPGWTIRTQRFGRFVPKIWTIRTQGLAFRTEGLDVSYPMFFFFFFFFFNFLYLLGIFASKIVRLIQPIECWSIRIHFCSFPILDLVFLTCIYSPMYDFPRISHCKSYDMNGLAQTE